MATRRIDETMFYVHVAQAHARLPPEDVKQAGSGIADPDQRVVAMLGARGKSVANAQQGGSGSLTMPAA